MENKELLEAIRGIVKEEVSELKVGQDKLKKNQQELKKKLSLVFEQTGQLKEFRTESNTKLDKIGKDVVQLQGNILELKAVTKENLFDIAKLKSTR